MKQDIFCITCGKKVGEAEVPFEKPNSFFGALCSDPNCVKPLQEKQDEDKRKQIDAGMMINFIGANFTIDEMITLKKMILEYKQKEIPK